MSSPFDWRLNQILAWLRFPGGEQHPRSLLGCRSWTRLTLAAITGPDYGRKSSSTSSTSSPSPSPLWGSGVQKQTQPHMQRDERPIWKLQMHKWVPKNDVNAEIHTHAYTHQRAQGCSPSCWIMYGEACCHKEMKGLTSRYIEEV